MSNKENITSFLLGVAPEKLSEYCASSEKIAEICAGKGFIAKYSRKHGIEIKKRRALRVAAEKFLPSYPKLPKEEAPDGYIITKKWHWQFETWSSHLQYKDHLQGEVPHFNITSVLGGPILHVYLSPEGTFLVIDVTGYAVFAY